MILHKEGILFSEWKQFHDYTLSLSYSMVKNYPGRNRRRRKRPKMVKTAAKRRRNPSSQKCIENTEKNDGRFLAKKTARNPGWQIMVGYGEI